MAQRTSVVLAAYFLTASLARAQSPIPIADVQRNSPVSFEQEILPLFQQKCLACHNASKKQGALVLESPQTILAGGDSGPAVVAGKSAESLLLQLASHQAEPHMPPSKNAVAAAGMTPEELGLIRLWIDQGATGSAAGTVLSPQKWHPLPKGINPIFAVAITQDGQFAACSRANQIFIYHVATGQLVTRLTDPAVVARLSVPDAASVRDALPGIAHLDLVQSLAFNPEGDLLASGSFREVKLWRRPRDVRRLILAAAGPVSALAVSPDGALVATAADEQNAVQLWRATGEAAGTLTGHSDRITSLRFIADGARLVSGSLDQSVRVWNVADGTLVGRIDTPAQVNAVELVSTGRAEGPAELLVTGHSDNLLRVWTLPVALPQKLDAPSKPQVAAVSPDQTLLAQGTAEGNVRIVDLQTGQPLRTWGANQGAVNSVAFRTGTTTPPRQLATAGTDGSVRLWDVDTGEQLDAIVGSLASVEAVAFAPDGNKLVAGAVDGNATWWNLAPPAGRSLPAAGEGPANVIALSLDGKRMAIAALAGGKPAAVVRDVESGNVTHSFTGHEGAVLALAFSPDGNRLVSGAADKTARVWNLADANQPQISQFTGHAAELRAVAFSPDGNQVLSAAADNALKSWNVADGALVREFAAHGGAIFDVAYSPGGEPVSACADRYVRYFNPGDGQQARAFDAGLPIIRMTLSRDGQRMAVATDDHSIHVFQPDGQRLQTLKAHSQTVTSLAFNPDNQRLVSSSADGRSILWEVATGRLLEVLPRANLIAAYFAADPSRVLQVDNTAAVVEQPLRFLFPLRGIPQAITAAIVHPNGQQVYLSSLDGTIRGFSAGDGNQQYAANHGSPVQDLAISPNGDVLASAADNQTVRVWSAGNGGPIHQQQMTGFSGPVKAVTFSPDGTRVIAASAGEKREVLMHDLVTSVLEEQWLTQTAPVVSLVALKGPAPRVIAAAPDEGVQVLELHAVRRIQGHSQPVTSLAAIPDAPLQVLSGSLDTTLRRWNIENGQQLLQLGHGGAVTAVAVRRDGQRYASASNNNTARLWNAQNNQQLAEMRGDLRLKAGVVRLTQAQNAANARQNTAKQTLEAAEKDLPVKTEAEKKAAEALAAANTAVTEKQTALKTADDAKIAAEKAAVEAAATAQKAALAKAEADKLAMTTAQDSQRAQQRAAQLASIAQGQPNNQEFAKAAAEGQQAAQDAANKAQAAVQAQAAPTQAAQDSANLANQAAAKAVETQKPYNDALAALKQAQSQQNLAAQTHAVAARELAQSQAAVPAAKEAFTAAEATYNSVKQQLEALQQQSGVAEKSISTVAFSPDGRLLATGGDFGSVHTWDTETGAAVEAYAGHTGPVQAVAFLSDALLLSGSADKSAGVWEANPAWVLERTIGSVDDPATFVDRIMSVDFSDDGKLLATGGGVPSRSGEVKVLNVADGSVVLSLPEAHTDAVFAVAISPDGKRVASGGADKYLRTFDIAKAEQLRRFEGHTNYVLGVAWKGDGRFLVSSAADNTVKVWNPDTGDQERTIENFGKHVTAVRFIGETENIVSVCGDRVIRMHNAANGGFFRQFGGGEGYLHAVDVTPNNQFVVTGGQDSVLRIWDGNNTQAKQTLPPPEAPK